MAEPQPYAELCTRVYTRTGKTAHLLSPGVSPNSHGLALCSREPGWSGSWRGTGSQREHETVADKADSTLAWYGQQERAS